MTTNKQIIRKVTAITAPAIASLLLALGAPALANHHEHEHGHDAGAVQADAGGTEEFVHAEVRSIDRDNGKLVLKHEAIRKFNMNGMTMGFRVADTKLMEGLAAGDKVRFVPDRVNGQYVITKIEKLQ